VITILLNVYLCGWLITTIGALVAANRLSDRRMSRPLPLGSLAVLAGVLWPVLVVGVVELIAIVVVARKMRAATARQSEQAPMERDEVLISAC
jgi:FtsH-binding integral membrane protein